MKSNMEPFPELEELADYLSSPEIVKQHKVRTKKIMDAVWEMRFWKTIEN